MNIRRTQNTHVQYVIYNPFKYIPLNIPDIDDDPTNKQNQCPNCGGGGNNAKGETADVVFVSKGTMTVKLQRRKTGPNLTISSRKHNPKDGTSQKWSWSEYFNK